MILLAFSLIGSDCGGGDDDDDSGDDDVVDDDSADDDTADDDTADDDTADDDTADDDTADDDTADDDTSDDDTSDDDTGDDDTGDDDAPLAEPLGEGEVRLGQITDDRELIGGPRAAGAIGDYKLYNADVEFIVRSPDNPGVSWFTFGGNLIDADIARPVGVPGNDGLLAMDTMISIPRAFRATQAEIVNDGTDGQAAILRVSGDDGGMGIVDGIIQTDKQNLKIVYDYVLEPDANVLLLRTTVTNEDDKDKSIFIADLPLWSDEMRFFAPRAGFEQGDTDLFASVRWVAGLNYTGANLTYGLATTSPDESFYSPYQDGDIIPLVVGFIPLAQGESGTIERLFIVGDDGTGDIDEALFQWDANADFGTIDGHVDKENGEVISDVTVVVQNTKKPDGKNYVAAIRPDASGDFSLPIIPGKYKLTALGEGRTDAGSVEVNVTASAAASATVPLNEAGFFGYTVEDGEDTPIPARVTIFAGHDAPLNANVVTRSWTANGEGLVRLVPGDYTVVATRGFEYELDRQNVTVTAGNTAGVDFVLERTVDTTGYMSGDFHIHTEFSIDSTVLAANRIRELAGEGIEMPVITDHDFVSDYMPYAQEQGLTPFIHPVRGNEVSPYKGHTNVWPLVPPTDADAYFGIGLVEYDENGDFVKERTFGDLWDLAESDYGAQVFQVNHPRDGSGWFDSVGYDPMVGVSSADPSEWSPNFSAIEVWNSGKNDNGTLVDWFSFLDQGYAYTMNGNSDSHTSSSLLGNPRNYFAMPTDDPAEADPADMVDSILGARNVVCNGPFISFSIEGTPVGGLVTGLAKDPSPDIELEIKVQAPSWVDVNYVRVYSNNGQIVAQKEITTSTDQVVRFDETISVSAPVDAYFVVEAGHTSARIAPLDRGEPVFAITNPIWVDVDGNGSFDAPGLPKSAASAYADVPRRFGMTPSAHHETAQWWRHLPR
ncbi:MAG: CehA/McbA family metallohydrolase [Deltaproteobacteria bacterium]|nr:CehA/McbA family metallohydrolase [Deltaproteobacteria bacterium]